MVARRFILIAVFALGMVLNSQIGNAKDFGKEAEGFIQTLADKAMAVVRSKVSDTEMTAEFRTLLNDGFDVRAIGKWVLGRYWRKAEEQEKEEYLKLFEDFIIATYTNRFRDYAGEEISFKVTQSVTKDDNDAIVRSEVVRKTSNEPIVVDWRVKADKDGVIKVVDVLIAGVSMSQTQRSEFASVIKRNGGTVAGLIEALKTKTAQMVLEVEKATE